MSELRRKLSEVGLDVDSSRETMIEALQTVDDYSTEEDDEFDDATWLDSKWLELDF